MTNEKELIERVATLYATVTNGAGKQEKELAKYILKSYYGVDTFFLNREGDYSSGRNFNSVEIFCENVKKVTKAINGEI